MKNTLTYRLSIRQEAMRFFALILTLSCIFAYAGAASAAGDNNKETRGVPAPSYIIGPEDVLNIAVWKNADLSKTVIVRPDGMISMPLIGDVKAMGRTPYELRRILIQKLNKYEQAVEVSVIVEEINSYKVFIFGDVNSPGLYSLKRRTSLVQAIALAGGFNKFASENDIILLREMRDGSTSRFKVRFDDIVYGKNFSKTNIILQPGDTIFVP